MKKDIGFWNEQGEYIPDIQEVSEVEMSNEEKIIIYGVDVSGWTDEEVYYKFEHHASKDIKQIAFDLYKQLKHKEQENVTLKTQYNCYACGNCKGKEDYINLEKHHKGLRKQFDKKVQTLQEIKAIVCGNYEIIDPQGRKDILKLITKAEEE